MITIDKPLLISSLPFFLSFIIQILLMDPNIFFILNTIRSKHMDLDLQEDWPFQNEVSTNEKEDKRQKKKPQDLQKYPYNCIGLIYFRTSGKNQFTTTATGFLISSNLVLTSAHSLLAFYHIQRELAEPISFHPALDGKFNSGIKVKEYKVRKEYVDINKKAKQKGYKFTKQQKMLRLQYDTNFDYMLIRLKEHIQIPEYIQLYTDFQPKYKIVISGYPASKSYIQNNLIHYHQFDCVGMPEVKKENFLYYLTETSEGQSGSPILWKTSQGQWYAIGMHKGGAKLQNKQMNGGICFSDKFVIQIKKWEEEMRCCIIAVKGFDRFSRKSKQEISSRESLSPYSRETVIGSSGQYSLDNNEINDKKYLLSWNRDIPSYRHFKCSHLVRRTIRNNNSYLQIISNVLPTSGTINLKIKVKKYAAHDSAITFGLMAQENMKKQFSSGLDMNSFGICSDRRNQTGFILQKKQGKSQIQDKNIYIREGDEMAIWINMKQFTFTLGKTAKNHIIPLFSRSDYLKQLSIPKYLKERVLYLFFTFSYDGDCIEIQND